MPLTKTGRKVMADMKSRYKGRGEEVFYRSISKGKAGSRKWHRKSGSRSSGGRH